jgi:hypothetical protein
MLKKQGKHLLPSVAREEWSRDQLFNECLE